MPQSTQADLLEFLKILLTRIPNLRDEKAIAAETLAAVESFFPEVSCALLRVTEHKRRAVVFAANGAWCDDLGKDAYIPQSYLDSGGMPIRLQPEDSPLICTRAEAHVYSLFPLHAHNRTWGFALLLSARELSPTESQFLHVASGSVAQAFVSAALFRRVEQFRLRMDLLTSVERAVNSSLSLSLTQNIFLDATLRLLEADAAALWVLDPHERILTIATERGFCEAYPHGGFIGVEESLARLANLEHRLIVRTPNDSSEDGWASRMMRAERFHFGFAAPLLVRGECKGVLEVFLRSTEPPAEEWMQTLETLAAQAAMAVDHAMMYSALERASIQLAVTCDATIEAFAKALDLRAQETEGHSRRVADMMVQMAERAKIPSSQYVHIRRGAMLHDIGKIGVPDSVLLKPGALDESDWTWMRRHPEYAAEILQSLDVLQPSLTIPQYHHERWDGAGYPFGLAGNQIPLAARLFAVVDSWDAMQSRRPYREPIGKAETVTSIRRGAGSQFDPDAVRIFLSLADEWEEKPPTLQ
jgi:HD-GYP domain-containing protein (c-di-GMP phosphodiesterase class II)